jgi:hypothetical protein
MEGKFDEESCNTKIIDDLIDDLVNDSKGQESFNIEVDRCYENHKKKEEDRASAKVKRPESHILNRKLVSASVKNHDLTNKENINNSSDEVINKNTEVNEKIKSIINQINQIWKEKKITREFFFENISNMYLFPSDFKQALQYTGVILSDEEITLLFNYNNFYQSQNYISIKNFVSLQVGSDGLKFYDPVSFSSRLNDNCLNEIELPNQSNQVNKSNQNNIFEKKIEINNSKIKDEKIHKAFNTDHNYPNIISNKHQYLNQKNNEKELPNYLNLQFKKLNQEVSDIILKTQSSLNSNNNVKAKKLLGVKPVQNANKTKDMFQKSSLNLNQLKNDKNQETIKKPVISINNQEVFLSNFSNSKQLNEELLNSNFKHSILQSEHSKESFYLKPLSTNEPKSKTDLSNRPLTGFNRDFKADSNSQFKFNSLSKKEERNPIIRITIFKDKENEEPSNINEIPQIVDDKKRNSFVLKQNTDTSTTILKNNLMENNLNDKFDVNSKQRKENPYSSKRNSILSVSKAYPASGGSKKAKTKLEFNKDIIASIRDKLKEIDFKNNYIKAEIFKSQNLFEIDCVNQISKINYCCENLKINKIYLHVSSNINYCSYFYNFIRIKKLNLLRF